MADTAEQLERRLERNEWLRPGEVATLLSVDRKTVDRLIKHGKIGYKLIPGTGRHRICDPGDVRREMDARQVVHRGDGEARQDPDPSSD